MSLVGTFWTKKTKSKQNNRYYFINKEKKASREERERERERGGREGGALTYAKTACEIPSPSPTDNLLKNT